MPSDETVREIAQRHANVGKALDAASVEHAALADALKRGYMEDMGPPPNAEEPPVEEPEEPLPDPDIPPVLFPWEEVMAPVAYANSNVSPEPLPVPAELSNKSYIGYQGPPGWQQTIWLYRLYNAEGVIENVRARRIGDFHKGREGHVIYANVWGDFEVRNLEVEDIGAQVLQLVWRGQAPKLEERENRMPGWDEPDGIPAKGGTLVLTSITGRRCGLINQGQAVRASWPISIFNPEHRVEMSGIALLNGENPEFVGDRDEMFASHGGISLMPGKRPTQHTPSGFLRDFEIVTRLSDRASLRLWRVESFEVRHGMIASTEPGERPYIDIVDDCEAVDIAAGLHFDGDIRICRAAEPFKAAKVIPYTGQRFRFPEDA